MENIPRTHVTEKEFNTSLPFAANAVAWTDIFTFWVPSKAKLTLTHFSNYMATADWGNVFWRILRSGIPVVPYQNIADQVGLSTLPRLIERVIMTGGDYCQIQISKNAASVINDIGIALRYEIEG